MSMAAYQNSKPAGDLSKQLCLSTLVCPNWPLPRIVEAASASGIGGIDFRGIEDQLDITRHPAFMDDFDDTMALLARQSLQMPCLNSSVRLVEPDEAAWNIFADEFARYAALAALTGTRSIRVFGGTVPEGMKHDSACKLARTHLQQLVDIAQGRCCPLVETHDSWKTAAAVIELLDGFAPHAAVLWDIEHTFRAGEAPELTIRELGEHLQHVHLKDSRSINGKYCPLLLGDGDLPVARTVKALQQAGYRNWICLETEKRWHPSAPEPEQSIPQFAGFVRDALYMSDRESAS